MLYMYVGCTVKQPSLIIDPQSPIASGHFQQGEGKVLIGTSPNTVNIDEEIEELY